MFLFYCDWLSDCESTCCNLVNNSIEYKNSAVWGSAIRTNKTLGYKKDFQDINYLPFEIISLSLDTILLKDGAFSFEVLNLQMNRKLHSILNEFFLFM